MSRDDSAIVLREKGKLDQADRISTAEQPSGAPAPFRSIASPRRAFLRIPPFPGAGIRQFAEQRPGSLNTSNADIAEALRRQRVGGTFWGAQPSLPDDYVLVRAPEAIVLAERFYPNSTIVLWAEGRNDSALAEHVAVHSGECDPWHMLARARAVFVEAGDEVRGVAALLGVPRHLFDVDQESVENDVASATKLVANTLSDCQFVNPFTTEPMSVIEAINLCGFWRRLVDSNRGIAAGLGFAFWKQDHVAPLLWDGSTPFRFLRNADELKTSATVAVWRSRALAAADELERRDIPLIEVEDGFLRSRGLGADCIPPLSIVADRRGAHFDPTRASELEYLLQSGEFAPELIERARDLRRLIVKAGIGKYECGTVVLERRSGDRRHILVPGQVEDDRAVTIGGCGLVSNLELLARVRKRAPDAYILYKPHPDVLAGHRKGAVSEAACLEYADEIVGELPIASLIAMVDEVHANTSLSGFEALLRGKSVTTYGVPFYAGWGLTTDLGPVPSRRTEKRNIDELVAATLLLYPRYLDPETGLPCPAEIIVARLSDSVQRDPGLIVGVRRLQGKFMRRLRSLVQ